MSFANVPGSCPGSRTMTSAGRRGVRPARVTSQRLGLVEGEGKSHTLGDFSRGLVLE